MRKTFIFGIILFARLGFAQFTTVTGTVIDPHNVPYALGTIVPHLVSAGTPTLNGQPYMPPPGPVGLDKNGHFSFNVADNTMLQPPGTQWYFTTCSATGTVQPAIGTGPQCFNILPLTISGSTQDISTQLNSAAPALTIPLGSASCPTGLNQIQYDNAGSCAGIANVAPGSALVSQGTGVVPATQQKPIYDLRDFTKQLSLQCDGTTDVSAGVLAAQSAIGSNPATLRFVLDSTNTGPCNLVSFGFSSTLTLDFTGGGAIKPITDTTSPGGGGFDQSGSGGTSCGPSATTCSVTVTPTSGGETYAIVLMFGFSAGAPNRPTSTVSSDFIPFLPNLISTQNRSSNIALWLAPNLASGSRTFTVTTTSAGPMILQVLAVTGIGKTPQLDGAGTFNYGNNSPMSSGAYTLLSGDFVLSFGGTNSNAETCTAGAGFTQPTGNAGNLSGASWSSCSQYKTSSSAGSLTATQSISSAPTTNAWVYGIVGIRPGSAQEYIAGGINNPDSHQIFYNATGSAGQIFFLGNSTANLMVPPDWWGGAVTASGSTNNGPVQAAITAAIGSGLPQYNEILDFSRGIYNISAETQWYGVRGNQASRFKVDCGSRGGLNQTTANLRVRDSQGMAYGNFFNCQWSKSGTDSVATALDDIDWNGIATPNSLKPQFLSFYDNTWTCSGSTAPNCDVGLLGAKSGGAAQFSNINLYNPAFSHFSGAGFQIGGDNTGRNAGRFPATNALAVPIVGGDFQDMPLYGLAVYGGGYVSVFGTSFEAGYATQTGYDMFGDITQGPIVCYDVRSESRKLLAGNWIECYDSATQNQATIPTPGTSQPVGTILTGPRVSGDGAAYKVTVDGGNFNGAGTVQAPLTASSGTSTTLTDTNQTIAGSVTIGSVGMTATETMTQAVSGSTGTRLNSPASTGTITGSVTSGTIGSGHTMTQASTGVTCTSTNAPTGSQSLTCNNFSGTADSSHTWTDGTTSGVYTPSAAPTFSATSMLITAATGSPDGTHDWVGGTTGLHFTPSGSPVNEVNWTANAFVGLYVAMPSLLSTTDALCYGVITANTTNQLTYSAGLITQYSVTNCSANPDTTTQFIVSCPWSHTGTVTCGGMQYQYIDEDVIGTCPGCVGFATSRLQDMNLPLGKIAVWSNGQSRTFLKNIGTTRADWYDQELGGFPQQGPVINRDWEVSAILPGGNTPITQTLPSNNSNLIYSGALGENVGTKVFVFNQGIIGIGANLSSNDSWVGGASDPACGHDIFRCRLETSPTIGPAVLTGPNQNGTDYHIAGGGNTGNGTPGKICFDIASIGSSGSTPNTGTSQWCVNASGNLIAQSAQQIQAGLYTTSTNCAQSGTAANPSVVSCTAAPSGAVACSVSASAGTCVVNTTAVGANSQIIVQETTKENTRLGVTCNTSPTVIPAIIVASQVNGTSFTINMPTITTNPACFDYWIVNQ